MAKSIRIAIIQFPGLNTEYETRREINRAGMRGEFFRWNEDPKKLDVYDGYVIGGGFSYEDRGRAGVIASQDPIMKKIEEEAENGKPVLGICNGAQIILEAGLIPGVDGNKLVMALARNKRIKDGNVLGTGYFNTWVHMKCVSQKTNCMFTRNINEGEILYAPIAHGEGRFTTEIPELIEKLRENGQMVFRYCDANGIISEDFPVNPNGAQYNIAAICNPAGNVMAIMPHPERAEVASEKIFTSMRDAILETRLSKDKKREKHLIVKATATWPIAKFEPTPKRLELFVKLIITDNEAETFDLTIKKLGFETVSLSRETHIELEFKGRIDLEKTAKKLIQSGVLVNTNKESTNVKFQKNILHFDAKKEKFLPLAEETMTNGVGFSLLVREKQDFVGMSKLSTIQNRLKMEEITGVKFGTLWHISIDTKSKTVAEDTLKKLVNTNIFSNPHRQDAWMA